LHSVMLPNAFTKFRRTQTERLKGKRASESRPEDTIVRSSRGYTPATMYTIRSRTTLATDYPTADHGSC